MFVSGDNVAITTVWETCTVCKREKKKVFISFKGKTIFSRSWLISNSQNLNERAESPLSRRIFKN